MINWEDYTRDDLKKFKKKPKGKTDFLFAEAQNNIIRRNHINAKIENTQQNSKCTLSGDRDKAILKIITIMIANVGYVVIESKRLIP